MKVVFLHGFALDGSVWRAQLAAFPGALAPDIPGFGSRQGEGEVNLDELEALVDGAHVIGHSFGAAVAVDLALRRADAVRSLILSNPLLLGCPSNLVAWSICAERAKAGDLEGARQAWLACPLFDGAREQVREAIARYRGAHWTGAARTAFRNSDPAPQLGSLSLPVLVVTSTRDQPSFRNMARAYHDALPHSRLLELEAGHMLPCEQPEQFNVSLRSFLAPDRDPR